MTRDWSARPPIPMAQRLPVGTVVGTCPFPLDAEGSTCGRDVKINSLYGRRPKYCGDMVDGVSHDAKTAAQYRKMFNIPADKPGTAIRAAAASQSAPAESISVTPEAISVTVSEEEKADVSSIPSSGPVTAPELDEAVASVTVPQSDSPVTDAVSRFESGTEILQRAVQQLTEVAALVVPDITGALEAAASAAAAEREVNRVRRQSAQEKEQAGDAISQANTQRDRAEKRAEEAEAERDSAITEKASAQAVAEWLIAEARWLADQAATAAKADRDQAVATAEAERDQAKSERDAANRKAAEVAEDAESRIDAANKTANEKVGVAQKEADKSIAAANEARSTAVGEANRLRKEVEQLNNRIEEVRNDRQKSVDSAREYYKERIDDLLRQNEQRQGTIDNLQGTIASQLSIIMRMSGGGLPATADDADDNDVVADSGE